MDTMKFPFLVLLVVGVASCAGGPAHDGPAGPAPPPLATSVPGGAPEPAAAGPSVERPAPVPIHAAGGDWDGVEYSDVLVAPGFEFEEEHSYTYVQEGSRMADLFYHGTMNPSDASAWFLNSMPSAGWDLERYSGLTTKVLVFRKGDERAMISVSAREEGTRLRMMIHPALD